MVPAPDDPALDLALVRDVLEKRESAILVLAERLRCVPRILGALNARFGNPLGEHDLADVVQDTMLILLRKLGEFRGEVALEGWVFRICRFELMNAIRQRRRLPLCEHLDDATSDEDAARRWRRALEREAIDRALERIGGAEAETLRLKHFEGLTFEEMAARVRASVPTMKARYYRAMNRFKSIVTSQRRKEDAHGPTA
jgi:RNA polymerase sigma factor (sigma-70 family)